MHDYLHYMFFNSQFGVAYHFVAEEGFMQFVHNVEANYKAIFKLLKRKVAGNVGRWKKKLKRTRSIGLFRHNQMELLGTAGTGFAFELILFLGTHNRILLNISHSLLLFYIFISIAPMQTQGSIWDMCNHCCQDVPYHRFHHGVDVLFTVFRLLQITHAGVLENCSYCFVSKVVGVEHVVIK